MINYEKPNFDYIEPSFSFSLDNKPKISKISKITIKDKAEMTKKLVKVL